MEYQAWLGVELCFQGFDRELATLPGAYAPPRGRLLLARLGDEIAGCIGLRPLDAERGEIKRLFVRSRHRGLGLGRRLVVELLEQARAIGYRSIVLDTLPQMASAQRLYEALGFHDIEPYYHNPIPGARYLELELAAR